MTTTIAVAILEGANLLRRAGVPEARREAGSLLSLVLGQDRAFLLTHADDAVNDSHLELLGGYLERRAAGEPLQYIAGRQEFFGLDFEVTPAVLIPRPETELLVEVALKLVSDLREPAFICDIGTGSGCIAVTLLHELPTARAVAVDLSPAALQVAGRNAVRHAVSERIDFVLSDCFAGLSLQDSTQSGFDLIVSNPPYVEAGTFDGLQREVREFEPRAALFAGADGLEIIRRLLVDALDFLKPDGHFVFEIGFNQGEAVTTLIKRASWRLLEIHNDLQGIPRIVALRKL